MFGDKQYDLKVVSERSSDGYSGDHYITSGILAFVYQAGTKTLATLYSDKSRTSLANPITRAQFATDDGLLFYSAETSVDIVLCSAGGDMAIHEGVDPEVDHLLTLDRTSVQKHIVIPFADSDNVETDTGVDLPYEFMVEDIELEVVTADSGETLDVGLLSSETAGDADGLLDGASVASTGIVRATTISTGLNETYISAEIYGALFAQAPLVGSDTAADQGVFIVQPHYVTGSNAVSVTYTGSAGSDTAAGYIHIYGKHVR